MAVLRSKNGKNMKFAGISQKIGVLAFLSFLAGIFYAFPALAVDVDDVAENMVESSSNLPGLITAACYALGLLYLVMGIHLLRMHVESPSDRLLRKPVIYLLVAGAFFVTGANGLFIYNAMEAAINGGTDTNFDPNEVTLTSLLSGLAGALGGLLGGITMNINAVLANIVQGMERLPGLVTVLSYFLGLLFGAVGLVKIKETVENPDKTPMKEGIIRLLIGGAMFALPTIYDAVYNLISGGDGVGVAGQIAAALGAVSFFVSEYTVFGAYGAVCNPIGGILGGLGGLIGIGGAPSMGEAVCSSIVNSAAIPAFLNVLAYLIGLILGIWGLIKIRDHTLNPQQTPLHHGISRLFASGMFFAVPISVEAIRATVTPIALTGARAATVTTYNEQDTACEGLDGALYCFMSDTLGPIHSILNFFAFVAGVIFIMIGISRLIKNAQDGARGPGGLGTIITFVAGGALLSYNEFVRAFTSSFFGDVQTLTFAEMQYTDGMTDAEVQHAHTVLSAVLKFMIIVGLISFVRGIFICRNVAEGNGQASIMAGLTHMVGGALAVNLGPLMNAVQTTLGLTGYGITFQ